MGTALSLSLGSLSLGAAAYFAGCLAAMISFTSSSVSS